ncbi:DNA-binding response regulator [Chryseobacterium nematophagum]|uniref:DNA-binding response regulator n=1 Tax=Chryseobacterium nematophagum TaxID=2305228 RepID=A0A3M7TIL4_9FLAO|nr:response regulator transcription factor [Chryseobacterium nematophagum]RNA62856.1 DNA-binding response regulator [Chryseobacterium nematophagum]
MKKKVLIADEYYVAIKGTSFILNQIREDIIIDYALNKKDLMDKVNHSDYDFLILDIEMLDNFFQLSIKILKQITPSLKIMVFTSCEKGLAFQCFSSGVEAIVNKSHNESEIREAFKSFFVRGYYYHPKFLYDFINVPKMQNDISYSLLNTLSDRERTVYFYLVKGNGCLEIANKLGLHQSTISIYKKRLFKKLKVRSLAELINLYHKQGVLIV